MTSAAAAAARVFVIGHRGMLGHVVARWMRESGHEVVTADARFDGTSDAPLLRAIAEARCDAVVNCAGTTPGRATDPRDLLAVNALLPQVVAARLGPRVTLVHASSDGVFSGARGGYRVDELPDADDPYGVSKRLGEGCREHPRAVILRTSIVGPELGPPRSLLGWLLAQRGEIRGFANHRWNGVTTLAWAKLARAAVAGDLPPGVHQPAAREPATKLDLLRTIARVFDHPVTVAASDAAQAVDRTLVATIPLGDIDEQLRELRAWYSTPDPSCASPS